MEPQPCPKCGGEMERGFVLDRTKGMYLAGRWGEGIPIRAFFFGVPEPDRCFEIVAMRCKVCGFLEHYAPET
jgi:hypothetical protein